MSLPQRASPAGGPAPGNIASHLPAMARLQPDRPAIVVPDGKGWRSQSFAELDEQSDRLAWGLERAGIGRGVRAVLMVKPSLEFFGLMFALFKAGAVPVLIDPGIGRRPLLRCLDEVEPEAFVGIPAAHVARLLFPRPFRKVRALVTVGRRLGWGGHDLRSLRALGAGAGPYPMAEPAPGDPAAILFTSGSTGIPKGAVYTHAIFQAQVASIRALYGIEPGEIDVATFPPFALFDPALGMTAVIPRMDARRPASADPAEIARAIVDHGATNMFASPALLDNLSRHAKSRDQRFPTLRRILSAGAPVRPDILARMQGVLEGDAQVHTPFGATESLPVASIGSREALGLVDRTAAGHGICVGRPAPEMKVRIIRIDDGPIEEWSDDLEVPRGEVGEIAVRGPVVTPSYFARPEQTRLAKIREGDAIVHRMGDLGFFDDGGLLWMCGRKTHRVEAAGALLFTEQVEQIFNRHPAVRRSALVGVPGAAGKARAVLVVEREAGRADEGEALRRELLELAAGAERTKAIEEVLLHPGSFPVDRRHNAKIEREKLARWAAARLARSEGSRAVPAAGGRKSDTTRSEAG
ncbi:MAG TPA: fatty acid CoA ligase family protein [Vulgatibacter sp.]